MAYLKTVWGNRMRHFSESHNRSDLITRGLRRRFLLPVLGLFVISYGGCSGSEGPPPLGDDASLSSLSISGVTLDPAFSRSVTDYTAAVRFPEKSTLVTATTADFNSNVSVNGTRLASGNTSDPIALDEGGNTITVNVTAEDKTTAQTYTVAIDRQSASEFAQKTYLKVISRDAENWFGFELALSADGETLAAGDQLEWGGATGVNGDETDLSADSAGAAYVFTRDSAGEWMQQAYVKASNTEADEWFGASVALSDDGATLAVGATQEDSAATGVNGDQSNNDALGSGAVYIYDRDDAGIWGQQAYIKASNTDSGDLFGSRVALSDDGSTLAVAARREASSAIGINGDETDNLAPYSGAVYVFTRHSGGVWIQQAYIKASNTEEEAAFGRGLSLSADGATLAVGAVFEHSAATGVNGDQSNSDAPWSGAVYIYDRDDAGVWGQQAYLKASNTNARDRFGGSIALSSDGSTLAVAASGETSSATGINGDETDNSAWNAGAVYVFRRDSLDAWTQQAYIKASNTDVNDSFGRSIALSTDGAMLVVGAVGESSAATGVNGDDTDNNAQSSGAVYAFTRDSREVWAQRAYIKTSTAEPLHFLGTTVVLSGDGTILAADALGDLGAVYFFEL